MSTRNSSMAGKGQTTINTNKVTTIRKSIYMRRIKKMGGNHDLKGQKCRLGRTTRDLKQAPLTGFGEQEDVEVTMTHAQDKDAGDLRPKRAKVYDTKLCRNISIIESG